MLYSTGLLRSCGGHIAELRSCVTQNNEARAGEVLKVISDRILNACIRLHKMLDQKKLIQVKLLIDPSLGLKEGKDLQSFLLNLFRFSVIYSKSTSQLPSSKRYILEPLKKGLLNFPSMSQTKRGINSTKLESSLQKSRLRSQNQLLHGPRLLPVTLK